MGLTLIDVYVFTSLVGDYAFGELTVVLKSRLLIVRLSDKCIFEIHH